jgi:hypothetical protein
LNHQDIFAHRWVFTSQNDQGAEKNSRISCAEVYIKPLLVQSALCAIRSKAPPEIANRYNAIKNGVDKKSDYRQNASVCHLQHPEETRAVQCGALSSVGQAADSV